jgi:carboxylesterase type B
VVYTHGCGESPRIAAGIGTPEPTEQDLATRAGATHGAELALLFAHPEGIRGLTTEFDPATGTVSDGIQQAWVAFATTGDPGWTSFIEHGEIRLLDDPLASTTEIRDLRCAALAELEP